MAFREPHKQHTDTETGTMSARKKNSFAPRKGELSSAGGWWGGGLAVQIIHIPNTDSGTNKLGSASREV